jgi:hypothetical protein
MSDETTSTSSAAPLLHLNRRGIVTAVLAGAVGLSVAEARGRVSVKVKNSNKNKNSNRRRKKKKNTNGSSGATQL